MFSLCKLALAITGLLTISVLLSLAEGSFWDYGCYKKSFFNCSSCKKECKWRYAIKNHKETEEL